MPLLLVLQRYWRPFDNCWALLSAELTPSSLTAETVKVTYTVVLEGEQDHFPLMDAQQI